MKIEGKRFAKGAVATPHYLASAVGLGVLADGGNAVDAIVAANLALGVVAPYFCGYGGDLFAIVLDGREGAGAPPRGYRSAGRVARGRDPRSGARGIRIGHDADRRPALRHRARCRQGLVRAARAVRHALVRRPVRPRARVRARRLPAHPPRCQLLRRHPAHVRVLRPRAPRRRARSTPSRRLPGCGGRGAVHPAGPGANHRDAARRRTRRVLPRSDRRRDRRDASAPRRVHDHHRHRRARERVGRAAPRTVRRRRRVRAAPADAGCHRARSAADPRRLRPARRRRRPSAPDARSGQARPGRPRRVRHRSRGDVDRSERAARRRVDRQAPRRDRSEARRDAGPPTRARRRHRVPLRLRLPTGCSSASSSRTSPASDPACT